MAHRWTPRAPRASGLVRPVPLDPTGVSGPTRGQARGRSWRRSSTGLYVPARVSDDRVEQRILEQGMRITARGAVTGWAALRLHGGNFFDGLDRDGTTRLPVPIAAGPDRIRPHADVTVHRETLAETDVVLRYGLRCTSVERALFDEMRRAGRLRDAVVVADMTLAAGLTTLTRVQAWLSSVARRPGLPLVRRALDLADGGSASPAETRLRLIWVLDAEWPRPLCNPTILDAEGRYLGRPDLLDERTGVLAEYDGAEHRGRDRHRVDVRREDLFRRAGLECTAFVGADLARPSLVVDRLVAARVRAGRQPRGWRLGAD